MNSGQENTPSPEAILREAHLKVTRPRKSVLKVLLKKQGPLSIEEIRQSMKKGECDRVTVYRSISALEKAGLISQCRLPDRITRFEFTHPSHNDHHHHIVCTRCKTIEHLDFCLGDRWKMTLNQKGYSDIDHSLEFSGICAQCRPTEES